MPTKVLIVDDEQAALTTMKMILSAEHEVLTAASGEAALALFEPGEIAVVVSDLKMPGMSGIDVLEEIAERDINSARILLTAYGNRESVIEAVNRGKIFMYLDKPCDPGTLQFAVRRAAERWILEQERQRLNSRLADMEKLAALGRFAACVGHDIRNYLVPILVASHEDEVEEMAAALETASHASEAILALVNEMQALAKDGRPSYRLKPGSITKVLNESASWLRRSPLAATRTIEMAVQPIPDVMLAQGSLRRVFINLIKNALEASPEGSTVEVLARRRMGDVVIEIVDHGVGMTPDVVDKCFEPFFSTKGDKGTGLGLYIGRTIVAGHGGNLTVDSHPGRGTRITIKLPLA